MSKLFFKFDHFLINPKTCEQLLWYERLLHIPHSLWSDRQIQRSKEEEKDADSAVLSGRIVHLNSICTTKHSSLFVITYSQIQTLPNKSTIFTIFTFLTNFFSRCRSKFIFFLFLNDVSALHLYKIKSNQIKSFWLHLPFMCVGKALSCKQTKTENEQLLFERKTVNCFVNSIYYDRNASSSQYIQWNQ